jgi:hypothetical protein
MGVLFRTRVVQSGFFISRYPLLRHTLCSLSIIRNTAVYNIVASLLKSINNCTHGHDYVELRDLTVSRLTLLSARRGGEPA